MKTGLPRFARESLVKSGGRWNSQRAFTLPNLMVSMSIFLVVIGGVLASHLFGLRMIEITKIKLTVSILSGFSQVQE